MQPLAADRVSWVWWVGISHDQGEETVSLDDNLWRFLGLVANKVHAS
jgi:hypothetical protein